MIEGMSQELESFYSNKFLRAIVQLVPFGIGSAFDTYLTETINSAQNKRLKLFFSDLDKGKIELTEEIIQNEDFLYCFFKTLNYVTKTRRLEKIQFFANLFANLPHEIRYDDYEILCKILDDLDYIELNILFQIKMFETGGLDEKVVKKFGNQPGISKWEELLHFISKDLSIELDQLIPMISRIQRTGCIGFLYNINSNVKSESGQQIRMNPAYTTSVFNSLYNLISDN